MNLKDVQKFDKLIQTTTNKKLNSFDEIADMIFNLIKMDVNTNQDELMKRVSASATFYSMDEFQTFLNGYFGFTNTLIAEFEALANIEDENKFNTQIDKLTTNILSIIPESKRQDSLIGFISNLIDLLESEYPIMNIIASGSSDLLVNLTKMFGNEDIAMMYMGLSIFSNQHKNKKMKSEDIFEHSVSAFVFVIALNSLRKENLHNALTKQATTQESANSLNYNVGRNDPCPCGSGRKYKKCCLNKEKPNIVEMKKFEEPQNILAPLTKIEMHNFFSIWSMFLNFVSMTYAGVANEEYIKIYDVNDKGEHYLTQEAMDTYHYLTIRSFVDEYFFMLVEHFIEDNFDKIDESDIEILLEARDTYKNIDAISYEMFSNGNAIFYDLNNQNCFYAYKTFYDYSKAFPKAKTIQAMFFTYKGRIITDGVAASPRIEIGSNMQEMMVKDYENLRKNLKFQLEINEEPSKQNIYQLKISIKGAKPPIWRRILVEPTMSFSKLHDTIQNIFNWEDYHLYAFYGDINRYVSVDFLEHDDEEDSLNLSSNDFSINRELNDIKDKITYLYDFGDSWEHIIILEKILPYDEKIHYPHCTGGKRAGPAEDCGGIYNYNMIVEAIEKPTLENRCFLGEDGKNWYEGFVPSDFDKKKVNYFLQREDKE